MMSEERWVALGYALLTGLALEAAWLTWLRPHIQLPARAYSLLFLGLALAFASLALGRTGVLGLAHGSRLAWFTRAGFVSVGAILAFKIGYHLACAWRGRLRHTP